MATTWIGQTIGNWRIDAKIGEGGCGQVFRGVDVMLDRPVALKVLHPRLASRTDIAERFRVEAHAMARLAHPNVATVYSFHREDEACVLVMEFVEGDTFEALLKREGPMPPARALPLIRQALDGVHHAHREGIVHRDLKATNLMLNGAGVVKVMDFGIAQVLGQGSQGDSRPVGTPEYMSPEQVRGEPLDGRADVYALGVLLFKLLTGRLPIRGDTPNDVLRAQLEDPPRPIRALAPALPEAVALVVERAMAKRSQERFADAAAFRAALEHLEHDFDATPGSGEPAAPERTHDGDTVSDADSEIAPTQVMWEPTPTRASRRRLVWAAGCSAAALLLGLVWMTQRAPGSGDTRSPRAQASASAPSPHRLPPLPQPPPVGFVEWPADLLSAGPPAILGPGDFAAIPRAPSLPDPISEPVAPPVEQASVDPPSVAPAKKARAPRVAKPQNRSVRNLPASAATTPPAAPEPVPERESGWVIRR